MPRVQKRISKTGLTIQSCIYTNFHLFYKCRHPGYNFILCTYLEFDFSMPSLYFNFLKNTIVNDLHRTYKSDNTKLQETVA